jgi:hypothetical protein
MTMKIIIAITIHFLIPLTGLLLFLRLKKKMVSDKIINPPLVDTFIIFATYGGLLFVTLTTFFWEWSGMASLGTFYLILGAPIAMGIMAYRQFKNKEISKYHKYTFKLGLLYFVIAPLTFLVLYLSSM